MSDAASPYANAKAVLPPGLLAEVQRHYTGHLWVPVAESQAGLIRQRVLRLYEAGIGTREIADLVQISQRRVQQIIRRLKEGEDGDNR